MGSSFHTTFFKLALLLLKLGTLQSFLYKPAWQPEKDGQGNFIETGIILKIVDIFFLKKFPN